MSKNGITRKILIDEPSKEDLFFGKGHERTARALVSTISEFGDEDRAIGLDGPWGSGKSSVVAIARQALSTSAGQASTKFHFFTYDIWKSQGSSFRRSFLEHFLSWAKINFPKKHEALESVEKKVRGKIRKIDTNNQRILDWYGIIVLFFLPFLPIYYFWAKSVYDDFEKDENLLGFLGSYPFILLLLFVAATFVWSLIRYGKNKKGNNDSTLRTAISQTLLINAKHYEDQKVTQHIREIDPNDFEFQTVFRDILSIIQNKNNKVIITLDNIDRLPRNEIVDHWAFIRSVFSRIPASEQNENHNSITAIVPYDRHLIESAYETESSLAGAAKREIFSKSFDEILYVAPPVMSNSRDFFLEKIASALPDFDEQDSLYRVYSIFGKILERNSETATPRQIISFINDLTGLFVLHDGIFKLPTVAAYLAYKDELENNPNHLTSDNFISERIRMIAADPELDRNLAAMIFNVEAGLAFQLLLDNKISAAALSDDKDDLLNLSDSPGFDLRVNDVLLNDLDEWQQSGVAKVAMRNFLNLLPSYDKSAKSHIIDTIKQHFDALPSIELEESAFRPYLELFSYCPSSKLGKISRDFVEKVIEGINEGDKRDFSEGTEFVSFLKELSSTLSELNSDQVLKDELKHIALPDEPEFLFGAASEMAQSRVKLTSFQSPKIAIPEDKADYLEQSALEYPQLALNAYAEFKAASLLTDDQWISIGNALTQQLASQDVEGTEKFQRQVILLSEVWGWTDNSRRGELALSQAFDEAQLYVNLYSEYEDYVFIPHAIFLARQVYPALELPVPKTTNPQNQRVASDTAEFQWFKAMYEGTEELTDDQYEIIAKQVRDTFVTTKLMERARENPEDTLASRVLSNAFKLDKVPWISLSTFLENFAYLKGLLDDDFSKLVEKFGFRLKAGEIEKVTIQNCPVALISEAKATKSEKWLPFLEHVKGLLKKIPSEDWREHWINGTHETKILLAYISEVGLHIDTSKYRQAVTSFITDLLGGKIEVADESIGYDLVLHSIEPDFHAEVYRQIREDINGVTDASLSSSSKCMPDTVSNLIDFGSRITRKEKDAVIRHLLCTALESSNTSVLETFLGLGRDKVRDYTNLSEDSTKSKLDGAWKVFSEKVKDRNFVERVGELLHGKKARSIFSILWGGD